MGEILIKLDPGSIEALERRAKLNGRAVDDEIADILTAELKREQHPSDPIEWARWIQAKTPVAVQKTDSLTLIREDRNR